VIPQATLDDAASARPLRRAVVLDVRTFDEFAAGHIPDATFMPLHVVPLRGYAHVVRFAGGVRRRGVVWIEAAEDAKAAPAWPEGARVGVRRLPPLHVAGEEGQSPRPPPT